MKIIVQLTLQSLSSPVDRELPEASVCVETHSGTVPGPSPSWGLINVRCSREELGSSSAGMNVVCG